MSASNLRQYPIEFVSLRKKKRVAKVQKYLFFKSDPKKGLVLKKNEKFTSEGVGDYGPKVTISIFIFSFLNLFENKKKNIIIFYLGEKVKVFIRRFNSELGLKIQNVTSAMVQK